MTSASDNWVVPRLPSPPNMGDIHHLLSRAMDERGRSFEICWRPAGAKSEFVLVVDASPRGGDASWRMFGGQKQDKPIWTYISCDVLLVYNLVVSSASDANLYDPPRESHSRITLVRNELSQSQRSSTMGGDGPSNVGGRSTKALAGELAHVQVPTLLQSILMAKMTGALEIEGDDSRYAEVFFVDGTPVHAFTAETTGEESIFDLLTWEEGSFHFEPKRTSPERSIKQSLDALLVQGMQLSDNAAYLKNLGFSPDAHIMRTHKTLGERDFETMIARGVPLNLANQKQFYKVIDEQLPVKQFLEKLRMPRSQWILIMCNLLRTELISIVPPDSSLLIPKPDLEPKRIDRAMIQSVMMSLRDPDTGMFTYPAFLYFLEQEYFRAYRSANPISVVVFQMLVQSTRIDGTHEPLAHEALSAAVRKISRVKRHVDLLAHYESGDFALLLPNTKSSGAQIFVQRIVKALQTEPLVANKVDASNLRLAFGVASIPEDFLELSHVLSAAEVAKREAMYGDSSVILYRDIK